MFEVCLGQLKHAPRNGQDTGNEHSLPPNFSTKATGNLELWRAKLYMKNVTVF